MQSTSFRKQVLRNAVALAVLCAAGAKAQDVSQPAILQLFEAKWDVMEDRMADIFEVGYGRMWVPAPARGGSVFSVGYDTFDRFDLGKPRDETHYGTTAGFKAFVASAHQANVLVNPELIWNHNGVGNRNDQNFVDLGGYPGFALTLPGDINGDFHDPFIDALSQDEILGQLAGLNDIAQEKNHQFVRHPVDPNNPNNIPAGTTFNKVDPNNARFYPDRDLGGTTVFDARLGTNVTLYDFNAANPLAGDAVEENALGLLMRNARWMVQEFDIDGFRLDAARHFPRWVLDYFDQSTFLAKQTPLLDGSPQHIYSFIETGFDSPGFLQDFIRKDIDNGALGNVGGNRDVLDFRLFNRLKENLTGNGIANNWHNIKGSSIDLNDDGLVNGSQGVAFVQSHDETGAFLSNVAHAYVLMLPGQALVYQNAEQFGPTGTFPQPGKDDALGGLYGDTITRLLAIRNSHGRGNFNERWIDEAFGDSNGDGQRSNVYIYERSNSAIVGLNSRADGFVETRSGVQTDFAPGTVLVELTGNAADATVDPGGSIPDSVRVDANGQIQMSIPGNDTHGRGYVIYGLATPQGSLSLTNVASTLGGGTPTDETNGTTRLSDISVIHSDTFDVQFSTSPVSLPDPDNQGSLVRDPAADGDQALLKIDGGIDLNNLAGIDNVTPGSVGYGFEEFTTTRTPGYIDDGNGTNIGTGTGTYVQTIDATQLSEGRHYVTTRAFRHRADGGPAVYEDFKQTIYIDRLPPEAAVASFEPFASNPNEPENRDLIVESTDGTADNMHLFLDLPAGLTDEQVIAMALGGQNDAGEYDRSQWIFGFSGVTSGNHVATVVTFEQTYDGTHGINVQRFPGLFTDTGVGVGFGDLNHNNSLEPTDLSGTGGFEQILQSNNAQFDAAADVTGDGLVDNRDLFGLVAHLTAMGAPASVYAELEGLLARRGDVDQNGQTNAADLELLYASFGGSGALLDVNVDGSVDLLDASAFVTDLLRTAPGDYNFDGQVDAADYAAWRDALASGSLAADGNFDGVISVADYQVWQTAFGFVRAPLVASLSGLSTAVPEPSTVCLVLLVAALLMPQRFTRFAIN